MPEILKRWDGSKWVVVGPVNLDNGTIELEDDAVYPTIVNSGYIDSVANVSTITGATNGNFLLAFLCSRSENPIISAPGWKVWGGYAPIKRTSTVTQRIWVLTKQCTGNDSIEFKTYDTSNAIATKYIIWYEFASAEIDWNNPISIPFSVSAGGDGDVIYLSKNINKLVIWAGHAPFFLTANPQPIWRTDSALPIIAGASNYAPPETEVLYGMGTLADTTKIADWASSGVGPASMFYFHDAGGMCSVLPVAVNHA